METIEYNRDKQKAARRPFSKIKHPLVCPKCGSCSNEKVAREEKPPHKWICQCNRCGHRGAFHRLGLQLGKPRPSSEGVTLPGSGNFLFTKRRVEY